MKKVTFRTPESLVDRVDALDDFPNRSEAIRQAMRDLLDEHEDDAAEYPGMWEKGSADD